MTPTRSVKSPDGLQIVYDVQGAGPETIVFVHGWTCNRSHWQARIKTFSSRYRTIAIDLGGHGESGLGRSKWSIPSFASDIIAVMNREQVERAVLVDHSMDGRVILHVARQLGQRLVGLVGADTLKYPRENPRRAWAERIRAMEDNYEAAARALITTMFTSDTSDSIKNSIYEGMMTTPAEVGIGTAAGMMADEPSFGLAVSLDVPIVVINARGSPVNMEASREPGIEIRFVTTAGHFVMLEDPDTFDRLLGNALGKMF